MASAQEVVALPQEPAVTPLFGRSAVTICLNVGSPVGAAMFESSAT